MGLDISPDLKVACYDLQNARPAEQTDAIRETALVLEDVIKTVCG
jgi:hypothetical protein